jgi:hypothetical protein
VYEVIQLHPAAPAKPALGQPCNGCGACCALEPCPAGLVLSLKRHGRCRMLSWSNAAQRYRCGLFGNGTAPAWWRRLASRWIAAGLGCDADFEVGRV